MGTHHCIVAQIAFDDAPIVNFGGITATPENSDKLAQRNLQITHSDNRVGRNTQDPSNFDARPSKALVQLPGSLLNYPDELMIDWKNTPLGSIASIYWPQVNASEVLSLATGIYGSHELSAADAHTIQCKVTNGTSYIPIPPGSGENFAGLFTIDLPTTVVSGQEFNIIVRRISTRQNKVEQRPEEIVIAAHREGKVETDQLHITSVKSGPSVSAIAVGPKFNLSNWRYVTGTFQVKIPVTTKEVMLFPEENTLAIMKWRLKNMSPANRWYLVLQRYISYLSARVDGLGGNSDEIKPSPTGIPVPQECHEGNKQCHCKDCRCERERNKCISRLIIAIISWAAFWILSIWALIYFANTISSRPAVWIVLSIAFILTLLVNIKLLKSLWRDCK
jgi:hypothetical protein